ncbi:MAG: hypothetical protein NW241_20225 [Bacteroidia bacterium]|nr:hypothetical protein [Bacteroidia bacterium]
MRRLASSIAVLLLILGTAYSLQAQQAGKKIRIADPGELYSTYSLADDREALAALARAGYRGQALDDLLARAVESAWPAGIRELDDRISRPDELMRYRARRICTFGDKAVLRIRARDNGHMPPDMRPAEDIYFVIGREGIR